MANAQYSSVRINPTSVAKMDQSRATCILGFTSNRWLDPESQTETKAALDKALAKQMNKLALKQKKEEERKAEANLRKKSKGGKRVRAISVPDTRKPSTYQLSSVTLHEAYQFLVHKYVMNPKTAEETEYKPISQSEESDSDDDSPAKREARRALKKQAEKNLRRQKKKEEAERKGEDEEDESTSEDSDSDSDRSRSYSPIQYKFISVI